MFRKSCICIMQIHSLQIPPWNLHYLTMPQSRTQTILLQLLMKAPLFLVNRHLDKTRIHLTIRRLCKTQITLMTNHLRIQVQILLTINLKNNINQFYIQCNTKSPLESQCRGNLGFQWGFFTFTHTLNTHFSHILIIGRVYQLIRQITLSVAFPVPNLSVFYISCTLICIIQLLC